MSKKISPRASFEMTTDLSHSPAGAHVVYAFANQTIQQYRDHTRHACASNKTKALIHSVSGLLFITIFIPVVRNSATRVGKKLAFQRSNKLIGVNEYTCWRGLRADVSELARINAIRQ
jgi:hypothetical protein